MLTVALNPYLVRIYISTLWYRGVNLRKTPFRNHLQETYLPVLCSPLRPTWLCVLEQYSHLYSIVLIITSQNLPALKMTRWKVMPMVSIL
jgi:hypothetical protein